MLSKKMMHNKLSSSDWQNEAIYLSRYAGSGVINTIIGFLVIFSSMALGCSPLLSNVAGYAVGFILGFVFSKKFVFRSNGHLVTEGVRYLLVFIVSFLLNLLVLHWTLFYMNAVVSQLVAAATYTFLMYTLTRLFVFKAK
jgi:putative flippase GtrA